MRHALLRLCTAAALVLTAGSASAYSGLVVFGDSLSDNGNVALAVGTDPGQVIDSNLYVPSLPYASGTFSDGVVWADLLAGALGVQAGPSLAGGSNFAFGGAQTRDGSSPSLLSQVDAYLGAVGGSADPGALFVLAGGGNNARAALEAIAVDGAPILRTVLGTAVRYAQDLGTMVDQLQAAGATDIVVWNTPNLGLAPAVAGLGPEASFLAQVVSGAMNQALMRRLEGEQGVTVFDLYGLVGSVVADPDAYGLVNATDACGAVIGCDPATYLFWDGIHPTTGGQALIAREMLAVVAVPEPGTWALMAAGGLLIAWRRRRAA